MIDETRAQLAEKRAEDAEDRLRSEEISRDMTYAVED